MEILRAVPLESDLYMRTIMVYISMYKSVPLESDLYMEMYTIIVLHSAWTHVTWKL